MAASPASIGAACHAGGFLAKRFEGVEERDGVGENLAIHVVQVVLPALEGVHPQDANAGVSMPQLVSQPRRMFRVDSVAKDGDLKGFQLRRLRQLATGDGLDRVALALQNQLPRIAQALVVADGKDPYGLTVIHGTTTGAFSKTDRILCPPNDEGREKLAARRRESMRGLPLAAGEGREISSTTAGRRGRKAQ